MSSLSADFGLGGSSAAYVFSNRQNGTCNKSQAFVVITSPSGNPSTPFGPLTCQGKAHGPSTPEFRAADCRVLAAADIDGDGHGELAVAQSYLFFSTGQPWSLSPYRPPVATALVQFALFKVEGGDPPTIVPFTIAGVPIMRTATNFSYLQLGGTILGTEGVICGPAPGIVTVWSAYEPSEIAGPYTVQRVTYLVEGTKFVKLSYKTWTVAQGSPGLLPQGGGLAFNRNIGLCGQPFSH